MNKLDAALFDAPIGSFPFTWLDTEYVAHPSTTGFVASRVSEWLTEGKTVFDGPQVRLATTPTLGRVHKLQPTSYYCSIGTNSNPAFANSAHDALESSPLSNNLGVSALPVTRDGFYVVRRQGAGNVSSAGMWLPGAAGGVEPNDITPGMRDVREIVTRTACRELAEENAIPRGVEMAAAVIGYRRDLARAGQPIMLVTIQIDATLYELTEWHATLLATEERTLSEPPVGVPCGELLNWIEATENVSWALTEIANLVTAHRVRRHLLRGRRVELSALNDFVNDPNDDVRAAVAMRGRAEHLDVLVHDMDPHVRAVVARHGRYADLDKLVDDKAVIVRAAVAKHGRPQDLDVLVHDEEWDVRREVARHARPQDLDVLVNDSDEDVRVMVARHGRPHDLDILVRDCESSVRLEVAKRGLASHCQKLLNDSNKRVRSRASDRLHELNNAN